MTARVRLMVGLLLATAASHVLAVELPATPERRFTDRAVIDCLKQRTAGVDARLKALEDQSSTASASADKRYSLDRMEHLTVSVQPVHIAERRRGGEDRVHVT